MTFKEEIQELNGNDLIALKAQKQAEVNEIELEILQRVRAFGEMKDE